MPFGQILTGPPGSGKTTYAAGLSQLLPALNRKIAIINLDPAAPPTLPYEPALDIRDLLGGHLDEIQREEQLGPNGAVLYAMEVLASEEGWAWLKEGMEALADGGGTGGEEGTRKEETYVVIDTPGQVEVFTHHTAIRDLGWRAGKWGWRACLPFNTSRFINRHC